MTIEKRQIIKYFEPPPIIGTFYKYQDVNSNKNLQKNITKYFLKSILKSIKKDDLFSHLKSKYKILKSKDGYNIIYKILKRFVKKGNTNWYDLRDQKTLIMDYVKYKLGKI